MEKFDILNITPNIYASFDIYGTYDNDLNLDMITDVLGVIPTRIRKRKEFPRLTQERHWAHDVWSFNTRVNKSYSIENHVQCLVDAFYNKRNTIATLKEDMNFTTCFYFMINTSVEDWYPKMLLSKEFVEMVATINTKVSFALYRY